jgi:hypothetical protein
MMERSSTHLSAEIFCNEFNETWRTVRMANALAEEGVRSEPFSELKGKKQRSLSTWEAHRKARGHFQKAMDGLPVHQELAADEPSPLPPKPASSPL